MLTATYELPQVLDGPVEVLGELPQVLGYPPVQVLNGQLGESSNTGLFIGLGLTALLIGGLVLWYTSGEKEGLPESAW